MFNKNLMEEICERGDLKDAFDRVTKNNGAPGIDNMQVGKLLRHLRKNWLQIKEQLLQGAYKPSAVRRVEIPKPDGKGIRKLGIPCVSYLIKVLFNSGN